MLVTAALTMALAVQNAPEATHTAAQAAPVAAPAPKRAKPICVSQADTGSILPREVCHTAEEWAAIQRNQLSSYRSGPALPGMSLNTPR